MRRLSAENTKIKQRKYNAIDVEHSFIKEIDDVFGLTDLAACELTDNRIGKRENV